MPVVYGIQQRHSGRWNLLDERPCISTLHPSCWKPLLIAPVDNCPSGGVCAVRGIRGRLPPVGLVQPFLLMAALTFFLSLMPCERKVSESSPPIVRPSWLLPDPKPPGKNSPTGEEVEQPPWPPTCKRWLHVCRREITRTQCHLQDCVVTLIANSLHGVTSQVRENSVCRNDTASNTKLAAFLGFCLRTECLPFDGGRVHRR